MADTCNYTVLLAEQSNISGNGCSDHIYSESQTTLPIDIWLIPVCYIIISFIVCVTNGLMLDCYRRCAAARTVTNFFIVQLSIADMSLGIMLPFIAVFYVVKKLQLMVHNDKLCVLNYTLFIPPSAASVLALIALTYDRYRSVVRPLDYHSHMTRKRAYLIVAGGVWTPALTVGFILPTLWHNNLPPGGANQVLIQCGLLKMMKREYLQLIFLPWFFILALVIAGLNVPIFRAVWFQLNRHGEQNPVSPTLHGRKRQPSVIKSSDIRMVKTVLLIFGTFFTCWLPCIVIIAAEVYGNAKMSSIHKYVFVPTMLNSALNPIIYGFRLQVFRRELQRRFPFCKCLYQRKRSWYGITSPRTRINSPSTPSSTFTQGTSTSPSSVSSIPILLSPVKTIA